MRAISLLGVVLAILTTKASVHGQDARIPITGKAGPGLEEFDRAVVAIMSRHPAIRIGPFEIRPADESFMAQHPVMQKLKERKR